MISQFRLKSLVMGGLVALLLCVGTHVNAKVYQASSEILQEAKVNKAAFKANPSADTVFELAMSYAMTGQIEKGWATLKKIPDYDKNYAPKVIEKYGALIKESPRNWKYHFKLAFGYYFLDQKDQSIACFRKVLDIDPKNVWALGFIALIKGDQGKIDEAVEIAKECNRMEPNAAALHFLLGAGYLKQGNYWGLAQETVTVGRLKAQEAIVYGEY
ncbi:tetratricopeptide repeat protein [bacterium]|nr:tetratricopeptide repeat protein [bacterium]